MIDNMDDLLHKLAQEANTIDDMLEFLETEGDMESVRYFTGRLEGIERALHIVQATL